MITRKITIEKDEVLTEVAKSTSYAGAKKAPDGSVYDHLYTTDEDKVMLERYWREAGDLVTNTLRRFTSAISDVTIDSDEVTDGDYTITLEYTPRYNAAMTDSIYSSMFSFFVNYIVGKWIELSDADAAQSYTTAAQTLLADMKAKIYTKVRPTREETV